MKSPTIFNAESSAQVLSPDHTHIKSLSSLSGLQCHADELHARNKFPTQCRVARRPLLRRNHVFHFQIFTTQIRQNEDSDFVSSVLARIDIEVEKRTAGLSSITQWHYDRHTTSAWRRKAKDCYCLARHWVSMVKFSLIVVEGLRRFYCPTRLYQAGFGQLFFATH